MGSSCLKCGGTKYLADGTPCDNCIGEVLKEIPFIKGIPTQYQNNKFCKENLPLNCKKDYGVFMEDLLNTIIKDINFYQKNYIICSKPNSGKTVWAYTLYSLLLSKGYNVPELKDIIEIKNIFNSYDKVEEANLISSARCAIIKIPRDMQYWYFDTISTIIERRVRSSGFTIFLYSGSLEELKLMDKNDVLKYISGNGSYNSIKLENFLGG